MGFEVFSRLVSLVQQNKAESRQVLVGSLVSLLMESFPSMSENEAYLLSHRAYAEGLK